jgi:GDPmannose 4,6-dehydratase
MKSGYENMKILSIEDAKKKASGKKVVVITGVTGQDGSFMADYLLANTDYEIFGGARRLSVSNHENVDHLEHEPRFHLINFDLTDAHSIAQLVSQLKPMYFINFAAQSFVKSSWDFPSQTWETNTTAIIHILEAIRLHCPTCRFYNAGSSEEFGDVVYAPQDEKHPMRPRSPYGASKAAARQLVKVYRESYNLYALQGWLFNHEGTRRGEDFVTRKITKNVARIHRELAVRVPITPMELGNIEARRDWTDAEDCVVAVWKMLNQENYDNKLAGLEHTKLVNSLGEYVVATGENHSIREFVDEAFKVAGIDGHWEGEGLDAKFIWNSLSWPDVVLVKINPSFYRPAEVDDLLGNPSQIKTRLGWRPYTSFKGLVGKMITKDLHGI